MSDTKAAVAQTLTSDNPVAPLTAKKIVKDFIADALLSLPSSLLIAGVAGLPTDTASLVVVLNAIAMPTLGAAYRALLRWAQSPD